MFTTLAVSVYARSPSGRTGRAKAERIYLGGFEIYREFKSNGNDIALERETLHIMDDKQRIALVETKTQGNDGSPRAADSLSVRQSLGFGQSRIG